MKFVLLIVEDDPALRETVMYDFERKGYLVLGAAGGDEGIEVFANQKVDLIISDYHMLKGNGITLLDNIKGKNAALPFFIFTGGKEGDLTPEELYEKGVEAVFMKPFDRKELHEAVRQALLPRAQKMQRQSNRYPIESAVGLQFFKSNFSTQTRTLNIGRGGMFIELQEMFPKTGEEVGFNVKVSSPHPLDLVGTGIVRWVRKQKDDDLPAGCGIEFTTLDAKSDAQLDRLLRSATFKSYIPRK